MISIFEDKMRKIALEYENKGISLVEIHESYSLEYAKKVVDSLDDDIKSRYSIVKSVYGCFYIKYDNTLYDAECPYGVDNEEYLASSQRKMNRLFRCNSYKKCNAPCYPNSSVKYYCQYREKGCFTWWRGTFNTKDTYATIYCSFIRTDVIWKKYDFEEIMKEIIEEEEGKKRRRSERRG